MATTGEQLVAMSALQSASAQDHLLNLVGGEVDISPYYVEEYVVLI